MLVLPRSHINFDMNIPIFRRSRQLQNQINQLELYQLYENQNIVSSVRAQRLKWAGQVERIVQDVETKTYRKAGTRQQPKREKTKNPLAGQCPEGSSRVSWRHKLAAENNRRMEYSRLQEISAYFGRIRIEIVWNNFHLYYISRQCQQHISTFSNLLYNQCSQMIIRSLQLNNSFS